VGPEGWGGPYVGAGSVATGEDEPGAAEVGGISPVTGHTVVEIAMVEVTTVVESAGQDGTSGAQLVMVTSLVV
jgi:hypothetical protein